MRALALLAAIAMIFAAGCAKNDDAANDMTTTPPAPADSAPMTTPPQTMAPSDPSAMPSETPPATDSATDMPPDNTTPPPQ